MSPVLLVLLLASTLARPVLPCLKLGDGPTCGCLVTLGGWYLPGPSGPRYPPPCSAAQLAYLEQNLPRSWNGEVRW